MQILDFLAVGLLGASALLYTMGGFAGGSMFIAILLISGVPAGQAALAGLVFNIFSTTSSIVRWRIHVSRDLLWFIVGSVPTAFLGGLAPVPDRLLTALMGVAIAVGGAAVITSTFPLRKVKINTALKVVLGAGIGLVAGLTGIGGGVYLAPILIILGIAEPKTTAATTTIFILLNSTSGVIARFPRLAVILPNPLLIAAIPAVIAAAQLGSYLGSRRLSQLNVRRLIGAILITVGLYLSILSL